MTAGGKTLTPMAKRALAEEKVQTFFKPDPPPNFIRQWRKHRGLTQEQLAERIGMTASSISQLERNKQGYTDRTLAALGAALNCHPGELLMRDPTAPEAPWTLLDGLKPAAKQKLLRVFRNMIEEEKAA